MEYTPTEALKVLEGITRKRLYEMMKNGDLSYINANSKRKIDSSELVRVFGKKFKFDENKETENSISKKQNNTLETDIENRLLQQKVDALKQQLFDKKEENRRLWEKLEDETRERKNITQMLLTAPQKPPETRKKFLGIF